jgi:hypothetical protein
MILLHKNLSRLDADRLFPKLPTFVRIKARIVNETEQDRRYSNLDVFAYRHSTLINDLGSSELNDRFRYPPPLARLLDGSNIDEDLSSESAEAHSATPPCLFSVRNNG